MNSLKSVFKFQLFSDIHLEYSKFHHNIKPYTKYLFLAGDIGHINCSKYKQFFNYCSNNWIKTFYVLGNHEYYSHNESHQTLNKKYKEFFNNYHNVYLLDDSYHDLKENDKIYRIYGSTLWSNISSTKYLNDFNMIKKNNGKHIESIDINYYNNLNQKSKNNLINNVKQLLTTNDKHMMVLTHFPAITKSHKQLNNISHPIFDKQPEPIKQYFSNDLSTTLNNWSMSEYELYKNILVWMAGHTHYSYDFNYYTRFISNQKKSQIYSTNGIYVL